MMNSSHIRRANVNIPSLLEIPFFENLRKLTSTLNIERLKSKLKLCCYNQGENVIESKNEREFVYIIKGTVVLYLNESNSNEEDQLKEYYQNQYFGEAETVNHKNIIKGVAETNLIVYKLSLTGMYQHLRAIFTFPELEFKINFIKSLPYFVNSHESTFDKMIENSRTLRPAINSILYSQGDRVSSVYVIFQGDFELSKKVKKSRAIYSIDVSTVSVGECLGIQEVIMGQMSQQTAKCVSSDAMIVVIDKESIKNCMINWNKSMLKSRSNWRKQRVEASEKMIDRLRSTFTEISDTQNQNQNNLNHYRSYDDYVKDKSIEEKSKYITNKKRSLSRPKTTVLARNSDTPLNLLPGNSKRPSTTLHTNKSQQDLQPRVPNSQLFFQQFLQKKQRIHNNMLMRYLKTRPPQLVFNPQKQYAVMKSLNVKPSNAVNNKKKTLAILKHRYFKSETFQADIRIALGNHKTV